MKQRALEELPYKPRKTAVNGDLNLPHELLETILSHLPTLDLIVATGVNMTFRTTVQRSPTLQRKLFLRPTNKPREFLKIEDDRTVAVATQREFDDSLADDGGENTQTGNDGGHRQPAPPWVLVYEIADLCPLLVSQCDNDVTPDYTVPKALCFSRLTPLAEHWASMYLTNPPTTDVELHLTYSGGYARQYSVSAHRRVFCETGITFASLFDAIYLDGLVKVTRKPGWWSHSYYGDMTGYKADTTVNLVIAELEEWWASQEWGCMMGGKMELDLSRTTVEIPELVFREWNEDSKDCFFRFSDGIRQYQGTAAEEVAASRT